MVNSRLLEDAVDVDDLYKDQFLIDVLIGLCSTPKNIPAKYFYDDAGSEIFQKITQHDDYYLTRTEYQILDDIKDKLPGVIGEEEIDIIELGAGDGSKGQLILDGFLDAGCKVNFYPIDISEKAMVLLEDHITPHPNLRVHGIVKEYFEGLRYVRSASSNKQLTLFLGSNIGNFNRSQNQGFLRQLWQSLNEADHVLIGFDLKKEISMLTAAYNDSAGHTKEFNLNLLRRINRELGGNFDTNKFQHFGVYNPTLGAMESYLLAAEDHDVYIEELERSFHFDAFEPLHLEYSYKFLESDVDFLCEKTGFKVVENFSDPQGLFLDTLWEVEKETKF